MKNHKKKWFTHKSKKNIFEWVWVIFWINWVSGCYARVMMWTWFALQNKKYLRIWIFLIFSWKYKNSIKWRRLFSRKASRPYLRRYLNQRCRFRNIFCLKKLKAERRTQNTWKESKKISFLIVSQYWGFRIPASNFGKGNY